jgi:hypothetical protein
MSNFAPAGMDAPLVQDYRQYDYMLEGLQTDPEVRLHISAAFASRPTERFCVEVIEADSDGAYGRVVEWPGGVGAPDRTELLVPRSAVWDIHGADHEGDDAPRDE